MKPSILISLLCLANLHTYAQPLAYPKSNLSGIAADPARVAFNLNGGESGTKKITVTNNMTDTIQFKLYFNDWQRDSLGGHDYFEPGKLTRSCARWITLDKTFIELKPGEKQEVQVKMTVPDSADAIKEMKWTMLFVESKEENKAPDKKDHGQIKNRARIGIHIYQTSPSLSNAEVKILNFCAVPGSDSVYRIVCQNVGNVQYDARSYMELKPLNEEGEKITIKPKTFPLFPEQIRFVSFTIPNSVPKGKYNAIAIVEAGSDAPLEAAQAIIEVK